VCASPTWYGSGIGTAVASPITALLLGVAAAFLIGEHSRANRPCMTMRW
jgi:hypothetical protein